MRGAGWEDTHWGQLFALLGFKAGALFKETVTLAHFLDKADAVAAAAEAIRALDAQVICDLLGRCAFRGCACSLICVPIRPPGMKSCRGMLASVRLRP
jgi:hypothetical protein